MGTGIYAAWRKWSVKITDKLLKAIYKMRNRNHDFTLLCPNCIGGNIYHRLGMKFLSPTVNLFTNQTDFIKMVRAPRHYMEQDIRFIESDREYPVGMIDDVKVNFNHDTDPDEAADKWYRRRERINWDNIWIVLYEEIPFSREEVLSLQSIPCKRLVVLTDRDEHTDLPYVKRMRRHLGRPNERFFLDKDYFGVRTFEKQFNFVAWLNGAKRF